MPDVPLPVPPGPDDPSAVQAWVAEHLGDLTLEGAEGVAPSPAFRGGQSRADAAEAGYDVRGYAATRSQVLPRERRGASALSPYVRHGLLPLPRLWDHVAGGPSRDVQKFRDELLWQEYARHLHARLGHRNARALRYEAATAPQRWPEPWPREMACLDATVGELERDGWLVNQTRMWLSSQWTVRAGHDWRAGEDRFYTHLLDGSRAANRLGWQWTVGAGTGRPYGFARWQVQKRAPELCRRCALRSDCPIESFPQTGRPPRVEPPAALRTDPDPDRTAGPAQAQAADPAPEAVWLTAESLGDDDAALRAHPGLPAVFVFDAPLLARWRLSGKRLVFLAETLGDLASRRPVEVWRGDPATALAGRRVAVTHAPVPGFGPRAALIGPVEVHPFAWLSRPAGEPVASFTAWRRKLRGR